MQLRRSTPTRPTPWLEQYRYKFWAVEGAVAVIRAGLAAYCIHG